MTAGDDRRAVSRIYEESWRRAYRGIVPQAYLDAIPEGRWVKNLDIPGWSVMLCLEDGEPVGTGSFSWSRSERYPDAGEVISIYLLPEYWGKEYGGPLLEAMVTELEKQGYPEAFLWVLEDNGRARRFYEKHGFSCAGETTEGTIGGKTLREVRYVRRLGSPGKAHSPARQTETGRMHT